MRFTSLHPSIVLAAMLLLVGCGPSGGGGGASDNPNDDGDADPQPAPTFVRSFGQSRIDQFLDLASDSDGNLWLVGNFPGAPVANDSVVVDQPWLANLDALGSPNWQLSPTDARGRTETEWKFSEITRNDDIIRAGDVLTVRGRNVIVERRNSEGDQVWEVQLDATDYWVGEDLTFLAARPGSEDSLVRLQGNDQEGWWVIVSTEAYGTDLTSSNSYGNATIVLWYITPNGEINPGGPLEIGIVEEVSRRDRETIIRDNVGNRVVSSIAFSEGDQSGSAQSLAIELHLRSRSGFRDDLILYNIARASDGALVSVAGPALESSGYDDRYDQPMVAYEASAGSGSFAQRAFFHLRTSADDSNYPEYSVAGYDRNLALTWTEDIPGRFAQVRALAFTRDAGTTLLWAAGRTVPTGDDEVPTLWSYSETGQLLQVCPLQNRTGTTYLREILDVEQGPTPGQLELLILALEETQNTPQLVRLIVDTGCNPDLASFREMTVVDDVAFLNWLNVLPELPTFGMRQSTAGGPATRSIDVLTSRRAYRFDIESGTLVSAADLPRIDVSNLNPTGLAVDPRSDSRPFAVLTGDAGQVVAFESDSQQRFNIALSDFAGQVLREPVIDRAARVWMAGESAATPLLRLESDREIVEIEFPECFWLAAGSAEGPCQLEVTDIDNGSVSDGWVHFLVYGRKVDTDAAAFASDGERLMILSVDETLPLNAQVRTVGNSLFWSWRQTTQSLDTLDGDADGVVLLHARARDGRGIGAELTRSGIENPSVGLYHFGRDEFSTWTLETTDLALHDAVLAHDGGVVLLLNATGENFTFDLEDARTAGLSRDLALVKLSAEGNPQWARIYGTAADDIPAKLERTATGYAIAAVSEGVDAVTPGSQDLFVIKTGLDGRVAADASGEDTCQAALLSENGELTRARLDAALGGATRSLISGLRNDGTVAFTTNPIASVSQSFATSPLTSENTARQCSGRATNIQEPPFGDGQRAEVAVQIFGEGSVRVFSGVQTLICEADCSADVVVGESITVAARADDGWRFSGWTGSAACAGTNPDISFIAVEGITQCIATFLEDQSPPSARFDISPPGGFDTTTEIIFDASASSDSDGSIVSYSWDFNGDSTEDARGVSVTRVFDVAGDYDVTLTVTDDDGLTSQQIRSINVVRSLSAAPTAEFTVTPDGPTPLGTILTLNGSSSSDDVGVISWSWDVGDDGSIDATGEVVQVTPPTAGMIPIRLRVLDADGQSAEIVQTVEVTPVTGMSFTLRVEIIGNGGVDIAPLGLSLPDSSCDGNECFIGGIADGTQLTLNAFGFTPSVFTGWSPTECDQVSADDCVITMDQQRSVTARFQ